MPADRIRYHAKSISSIVLLLLLWSALDAVWIGQAVRQTSWTHGLIAVAWTVSLILQSLSYFALYWEFTLSGLLERRGTRTSLLPYEDINYVGPVTGKLKNTKAITTWIEIRSGNSRKALATPTSEDGSAFLNDLRARLPELAFRL